MFIKFRDNVNDFGNSIALCEGVGFLPDHDMIIDMNHNSIMYENDVQYEMAKAILIEAMEMNDNYVDISLDVIKDAVQQKAITDTLAYDKSRCTV